MENKGIWIAEDDADDLLFYREALLDLGVSASDIRCYTNGQSVLDKLDDLKNNYPFLLILDGRMPLMGGMAVVRELEQRETLPQIHIAVISDSLTNEDLSYAHARGVLVYPKPAEPKKLVALMQQILAESTASS